MERLTRLFSNQQNRQSPIFRQKKKLANRLSEYTARQAQDHPTCTLSLNAATPVFWWKRRRLRRACTTCTVHNFQFFSVLSYSVLLRKKHHHLGNPLLQRDHLLNVNLKRNTKRWLRELGGKLFSALVWKIVRINVVIFFWQYSEDLLATKYVHIARCRILFF